MQRTSVVSVFCLILGVLFFFLGRIIYVHIKTSRQVFIPQTVSFTLHPPQGAIQAKVTGRGQPTSFVEGDALATGDNGSAVVAFPTITLTLKNNTEIDYLSGLPNNIVVRQSKGTIRYITDAPIKPFSIRSLGLLTQIIHPSSVTITTHAAYQSVTVTVASGEVTLAYSDASNNTKVVTLTKNQHALYDYTQSTLELE